MKCLFAGNALLLARMTACYGAACRTMQRKIPPSMTGQFDGADFVGDAFAYMLANPSRYAAVDPILPMVLTIARRRMIEKFRLPRNGRFTIDLGEVKSLLVDTSPGPCLLSQAAETYETILAAAGPGADMVELKRRGYTCPEIAARTGRNVRGVQRFFEALDDSYPSQTDDGRRSG